MPQRKHIRKSNSNIWHGSLKSYLHGHNASEIQNQPKLRSNCWEIEGWGGCRCADVRDTNRRNMHEAAKQSSSQEVQRECLTVNEACDLEARSKDRKIVKRERVKSGCLWRAGHWVKCGKGITDFCKKNKTKNKTTPVDLYTVSFTVCSFLNLDQFIKSCLHHQIHDMEQFR